jgi:hypothetical protein
LVLLEETGKLKTLGELDGENRDLLDLAQEALVESVNMLVLCQTYDLT